MTPHFFYFLEAFSNGPGFEMLKIISKNHCGPYYRKLTSKRGSVASNLRVVEFTNLKCLQWLNLVAIEKFNIVWYENDTCIIQKETPSQAPKVKIFEEVPQNSWEYWEFTPVSIIKK